jgi:hypothetical protein
MNLINKLRTIIKVRYNMINPKIFFYLRNKIIMDNYHITQILLTTTSDNRSNALGPNRSSLKINLW